ncbi:MAG: glycosyltransferase [Nanoarchaeota archaeon]
MFNSQFFETKTIVVNKNADIIFVSDLFVEDYVGGAELTSQALIEESPFSIQKIKSSDITIELLKEGQNKFWIFGNFCSLNWNLIPTIVVNLKYANIIFDYAYCKYRSEEKHHELEKNQCDCFLQQQGKLVETFYNGARSIWWMSENQAKKHHVRLSSLRNNHEVVLSSVLNKNSLNVIKNLRNNNKSDIWIVQGTDSWIKGTDSAKKWCMSTNKNFKIVQNVSHEKFLEELSKSKGFVYLPKGDDTCPRTVIEAKLLNCELQLNDYVQHKDEKWFNTNDICSIEQYLEESPGKFWGKIEKNIVGATISGYVTTYNCISQEYPFYEAIQSLLGFCDEVVVVDGGSTDGTWEALDKLSLEDNKLKPYKISRNWKEDSENLKFSLLDGIQKAEARNKCTMDFCFQLDSDEIVCDFDYEKIKILTNSFPHEQEMLALPVIEVWGSKGKVRCDVNSWKWRLSKNLPHITHGIPKELRKYDNNGKLYSAGCDGAFPINKNTGDGIVFMNFVTPEIDKLRIISQFDDGALKKYEQWFNEITEQLPCVYHMSHWNLARTIKKMRNYWQKHWNNLYNNSEEDTSENNMCFNKPWKDVSEKEIIELAKRLENEMGGWIFLKKIDFSQTSKSIVSNKPIPKILDNWCKRNKLL